MHKVTHLEDAPHKCGKCNKTFNQKANLKAHLLTHEDDIDVEELDDMTDEDAACESVTFADGATATPVLDLSQRHHSHHLMVFGRQSLMHGDVATLSAKREKSRGFSIDEILRK